MLEITGQSGKQRYFYRAEMQVATTQDYATDSVYGKFHAYIGFVSIIMIIMISSSIMYRNMRIFVIAQYIWEITIHTIYITN